MSCFYYYAECHYAESNYAECHVLVVMLGVIRLNVVLCFVVCNYPARCFVEYHYAKLHCAIQNALSHRSQLQTPIVSQAVRLVHSRAPVHSA